MERGARDEHGEANVDELELSRRPTPGRAPSPEVTAPARGEEVEVGAAATSGLGPRRRWPWLVPGTAAVALVAGVAVGSWPGGSDDRSGAATDRTDVEATATVPAPPVSTVGVPPCGSRLPGPVPTGPRARDPNEMVPESVGVRPVACRAEVPITVTLADGRTLQQATSLRELIERFGGLEGSVVDEFGRAHPISLARWADADPDTTVIGLIWTGTLRNPPSSRPPSPAHDVPPWISPRP